MPKKCYCIEEDDEVIPNTNRIEDADNQFMLTPQIHDNIKKNDEMLCMLSDLISDAIKKSEDYDYSNIKPQNDVVMFKEPGDMDIFMKEDFSCNDKCSKNIRLGFFEREETKYLLLIIGILIASAILFK